MNIAFIGFGEAAPVFASALKAAGHVVAAYDIKQNQPEHSEHQIARTRQLGVRAASDHADALNGCELVISTVTASQAIDAARQAAPSLYKSHCWLDLNSVSPQSKQTIGGLIAAQGATHVEGVAMDTVPVKGTDVPILLCGPKAAHWSEVLNQAGLNTRAISTDYGVASTTKMLRSIIIKGMESLFAESMEAASKVNATDEVIASLQATYPDQDWNKLAGYQLSRTSIHAGRRAAEMREVAEMLNAMDVTSTMANATAMKQQELADRELGKHYTGESINDFIAALVR